MIGECLKLCRELGNVHARSPCRLRWYVPRELTTVLVKFIDHGGMHYISCRVRGRPQQGKGLEVSCNYVLHVSGKKKLLQKHTAYIQKVNMQSINVCVVQCYILACIAV